MTTDRALLARSAAVASISVALILVALKTWASWRTGSTAMLGSLADSALDLVASLATLTGVWIASMPADEDHRFGHGKAEALAAIFQVMLIALSAFGIAVRAIMQLAAGGPTAAAQEGIAVSLIAIALTFALLSWQRFVMNRTRSLAIQTDHQSLSIDLGCQQPRVPAATEGAIDQRTAGLRREPFDHLCWEHRLVDARCHECVSGKEILPETTLPQNDKRGQPSIGREEGPQKRVPHVGTSVYPGAGGCPQQDCGTSLLLTFVLEVPP